MSDDVSPLCSATNYLLGATPLKFPAYLVGSLAGLTFWCSIYATLGGAGRELLNVCFPFLLLPIYAIDICHAGMQRCAICGVLIGIGFRVDIVASIDGGLGFRV